MRKRKIKKFKVFRIFLPSLSTEAVVHRIMCPAALNRYELYSIGEWFGVFASKEAAQQFINERQKQIKWCPDCCDEEYK